MRFTHNLFTKMHRLLSRWKAWSSSLTSPKLLAADSQIYVHNQNLEAGVQQPATSKQILRYVIHPPSSFLCFFSLRSLFPFIACLFLFLSIKVSFFCFLKTDLSLNCSYSQID